MTARITSTFALLDIQKGRKKLAKRFDAQPDDLRIPVTITGYLFSVFGADDGVSQEFCVEVEKLEVGE